MTRTAELDETNGQEELFSLGGFIEEETRRHLKDVWMKNLSAVCERLNIKNNLLLGSDKGLIEMVGQMIDDYTYDESGTDLYGLLSDKIEDYCRKFDDPLEHPDGLDDF